MKEAYKRPFLIKILNVFLFPKEYSYPYLENYYKKKFKMNLPDPVSKYLRLFMQDIYKNNNFDPIGKCLLNGFIFQNLKNLAYVEKNSKKFNKKAIFIISMPRTGSTFFHNFLGSDNRFKCLSFWELNDVGKYDFIFIRKLLGKLMLSFQNYLTPEIKNIHFVENNGPEECSKILLSSFITQIYPLMFKLPSYENELKKENFEYTYEFYFKALSLIKTQKETFLLKAPMHLQAIDQIRKHSADSPILFLHRDLKDVLSSAYSLAKTYAYLFTPKINQENLIDRINNRLSIDLDKALIETRNDKHTYHYHYNEITGDKEKLLKQLQGDLGFKFKTNYIEKRKNYKKHQYLKINEIPNSFKSYQNFVTELQDSVDQQST